MADTVLVTESGFSIIDTFGNEIGVSVGSGPLPEILAKIIKARVLVQDPENGGILYNSEGFPGTANDGDVFTEGDGSYYRYDGAAWNKIKVQFPDVVYATWGDSAYAMARHYIIIQMGRVNPETWLTSFNAGGQSTSFASPADYLSWLQARLGYLQNLEEQANETTGSGYASFCSKPIGAY